MAAVLAAGPGAVLSHRDAAALHNLRRPHGGRIDVTTVGDARSTRACTVHGTVGLAEEDVTTVEADREKRTGIEVAGYRVVEFTDRHLTRRRAWGTTQLRLLLS